MKRLDALNGERERIDAESVTEQVLVAREGRERSGEHTRERQARQRRVPASSLKDRMQSLLASLGQCCSRRDLPLWPPRRSRSAVSPPEV